jgi:hypothetical protein
LCNLGVLKECGTTTTGDEGPDPVRDPVRVNEKEKGVEHEERRGERKREKGMKENAPPIRSVRSLLNDDNAL